MLSMFTSTLTPRSLCSTTLAVAPVHLHGGIITPQGLVQDGTVVLDGPIIRDVLEKRTPAADGGSDIDTGGLMCPGFVDAHNHAPYAAFPRWRPARFLRGRFDWRSKTRCNIVVVPEPDPYYAANVSRPFKAVLSDATMLPLLVLYGQLRGLVGGATTMVIDADLDPDTPMSLPGLARDPGDWSGRVWGILDVSCATGEPLKKVVEELEADRAKLVVHVGEGFDEFSRGEFLSLELKRLLTRNTALVHAMALLETDWERAARAGASVIWSPRSNTRLYGRTIDVGAAIGAGLRVALAPDWTITGSSTMLDEVRYVRRKYPWIDPELLLEMTTANPADILGLKGLGRIEPGCYADLLVVPRCIAGDRRAAAEHVLSRRPRDILLAVVNGAAVYGEPSLLGRFPHTGGGVEVLSVPDEPNGSFARGVRLTSNDRISDALKRIDVALKAQGLTRAPLWEPD